MDSSPVELAELGKDNGFGNLVGIQPYMQVADYASDQAFCQKIDGYLVIARDRGWLNPRTVVVLPEYLGTWLVAADEKSSAYHARTMQAAMQELVFAHPLGFTRKYITSKEKDRLTATLFRLKAEVMARIYQAVFSRLAKEYAVTLVAGSILLPDPRVVDGSVATGDGPLYNTCIVYDPSGRAQSPLCRKAFPIPEEQPFTKPAPVEEIPAYPTPAGKLGVMICADAWIPACHARLKTQGVDIMAVPSYAMGNGIWDQPWGGMTVGEEAGDPGYPAEGLTEGQAWRKFVLPGRLAESGAKYGINVFLRGEFWELGADGYSIVASREKTLEAHSSGAAILNLWFDQV